MKTFKIAYTSDVHGQLLATHYPTGTTAQMGLSRVSSYLKQQEEPVLFIDNGDLLQGSPLMDYSRQTKRSINPAAMAMNLLHAKYITLGNHDFNFGMTYLQDYLSQVDATLLCANVFYHDQPLGELFVVDQQFGIRIGLIGVTTAYVPHWEQVDNIQGVRFESAAQTVETLVHQHRSSVDLLIVVYHGGFENDPITKKPIGRQTIENEAAAISAINGVDVILTGHQHMSIEHQDVTPKLLQPKMNATEFGVVTITIDNQTIVDVQVALIQNEFFEDASFVEHFSQLEADTATWLDQPVGHVKSDLRVASALEVRRQPHRLVDWIHQLQRLVYNADISIVSLPNDMAGFFGQVSVRDLVATFVFANTLTVLSMKGSEVLAALEQTAGYFEVENGNLRTSPAFLYPKVEHYNYDMYHGIDYEFDISKPLGQRLIRCLFHGNPIETTRSYTVICNNYRAGGGGDYPMFETAEVIREFDQSYFDLAVDFIKKNHPVRVELSSRFKVSIKGEETDPELQ